MEWLTEWSNGGNGRMAEMATYVLFTVHTDTDTDDDTLQSFIVQTWSGSKRVPFATIAELLNELSFNQKQELSPNERGTSKYFNDLKKMQNKFFSTRTCLNWKKTNPNRMKQIMKTLLERWHPMPC